MSSPFINIAQTSNTRPPSESLATQGNNKEPKFKVVAKQFLILQSFRELVSGSPLNKLKSKKPLRCSDERRSGFLKAKSIRNSIESI